MIKMMEPIKIKFKPYNGGSDEGIWGKMTKITLLEDRLEYDVNYQEKVEISIKKGEGEEDFKESLLYVEESGTKDKNSITNLVKFTETKYDENGEPIKVFCLDISNASATVKFAMNSQEDRDKVYNDIYNWKYGKA